MKTRRPGALNLVWTICTLFQEIGETPPLGGKGAGTRPIVLRLDSEGTQYKPTISISSKVPLTNK